MAKGKRTAEEVFNDHLEQSQHGSVEVDMERNYNQDVVLLTGRGLYRGHKGLRCLAQLLQEVLPNATFTYYAIWTNTRDQPGRSLSLLSYVL